jgi:signal transduction histidine kinase
MGTRIGLYVSKKQIERIGGGIEVKSKSGQGTVFKVVLPDHQDPGKLKTGTRDQ